MNRYQDIESELNKMRKKTFVTVELPVIERSPQDRFIFTNSNDRLDNLAFEFYGDPRHWVVLALANNLGKGTLIVEPNLQLRIPPQSVITTLRQRYKATEEER